MALIWDEDELWLGWKEDMLYAHLSRQVFQTQCQALLQRSAAGITEDDGVWVDVDAIGIDARAFWLYECDALLHCAVVRREDIMGLLRWKSTEHVPNRWSSGALSSCGASGGAGVKCLGSVPYLRPDILT